MASDMNQVTSLWCTPKNSHLCCVIVYHSIRLSLENCVGYHLLCIMRRGEEDLGITGCLVEYLSGLFLSL
jgi:hypothetical protein